MTSSTPPSPPQDPSQPKASSGLMGRFLDIVEKVGNKLPDPAFLFLGALVLAWIFSAMFAGTEFETAKGTQKVTDQMSTPALVAFMTGMVKNFTGFGPIGVVLVAMLGFGVAEKSGYIRAGLKILLSVTPVKALTPMLAFIAIISHTAVDAGYVLVIPVGGVLFYAAGRHPMAGVCAAFAGVSGGFSANVLPGAIDALLQELTQDAAGNIEVGYKVAVLCNWGFMAASSVVVVSLIWFITDKIIEPRLNRLFPLDADAEIEEMEALDDKERKGFIAGSIGVLIGLGALAALAIPSGSALRDPNGNIATFDAPLMQMIVPLLFILALIPGLVHGIVAGTIKSNKDVVAGMTDAMKGMGHYLVIMFFAAQFAYVFKASNLGSWMAVSGADGLKSWGLPASVTIIGMVLLTGFVNLLLGSASAKWSLLSVIFVPLLMELGISPAYTQAAYRVGDSTTNIITPLMPYFPLVVVYCQRYFKGTGIGTLISLMLPYSVAMLVGWTAFLVLYASTGIPLGIEGGYVYPK